MFLDPALAANAAYVGAIDPDIVPPTFDEELELPPQDENLPVPEAVQSDLRMRYREIARLHAMGKTNKYICERLNYTPSAMSTILKRPEVRAEATRYRALLYDKDITSALKGLGPDAISVIRDFIHDENAKKKDRVDAAIWLAEKLTGKAKQEGGTELNTLAAFMDLAKQMVESGERVAVTAMQTASGGSAGPGAIDVTPQHAENTSQAPVRSKYAGWSGENL